MKLGSIKRPVTACGKPVIKLVTVSDCIDVIGGDYYGTGTPIEGTPGVEAFPFQKITNLRGFITDSPREITRQVSLNCRTQKVRSAIPYRLQGADAYPVWKMRELEEMFQAKTIIIDGYEVIFRGGTMFSQLTSKACSGIYRLDTTVQECDKQQIYGCESECGSNCMYFLIPANLINQTFFNEAGAQVANSYALLLDWYRAQSGVDEVTDIPGELNILCDYYKIFKVEGSGYIPSVFYYDSTSASNKVFGRILSCTQPDYSKLCNGVDNTSCVSLLIGVPVVLDMACEALTLGTPVITEMGLCMVVPFPNWVQHTGTTDLTASGNIRTLNLSLFNPDYVLPDPTESGQWVHTIVPGDNPCSFTTDIPLGVPVNEVLIEDVPLDPANWDYDPGTGVLTFTPCQDLGVTIKANYATASNPPNLSGQVIAQISGENCRPTTTKYLNSTNSSEIPVGATLIIEPNGDIRWIGIMTSSGPTGSIIEVTNIIYNV